MALKDKILDKAQKYMLKGNIDKALAEYRSAVELDPRDISIRLRIGDLYVKTDRTEDAIKEYTEVARANALRGFYPKAIAVYKKVLKLDDSILDIHYKLADLYTKQRLIADAISSYSYIVSTFEKKGKTSEVMELLKKMLEIDPDNVGIRLKLADLFLKLSFEKDAVGEYANIFEKLIADGKIDRAEKIFLSLYNARPNEPVILHSLAEIYKKKGDEAKYLNYARPLLKTYMQNEDVERALALSKSILDVRPDDDAALEVIRGIEPPELIHPEHGGAATNAGTETAPGAPAEDFSVASSQPSDREAVEADQSAAREEDEVDPLISWPEEDIEISVEGFDDERAESAEPGADAFKDEEEFEVAVDEEPVDEEPVAEEPVAEEPVTEEPVTEEPVTEEPVAEEQVIEQEVQAETEFEAAVDVEPEPALEESQPEEPVQPAQVEEEEEPVTEEPVAEEPVAEEPVEEEPVQPAQIEEEEEPVAEEPVVEEPSHAAEAVAPELSDAQTATDEREEEDEVEIDLGAYGIDSTAKAAPSEEPTPVHEPVEEPVEELAEELVEEPVAEEPVAEEPVVEEPVEESVRIEEALEEEATQIEEPVAEEPVAEEPVKIEEAPEEESAQIEEPVVGEEASLGHAAEESFEIEEAEEERAVEEAVPSEELTPVHVPVEEPVEEIVEEQALEDDTAGEPVAEEPVVEERAEEPVAGEETSLEHAPEDALGIDEAVEIEEAIAAEEAPAAEEVVSAEEPVHVEEPAEEPVDAIEEEQAHEEVIVDEPVADDPLGSAGYKSAEDLEDAIERVLSDDPFIVDAPSAIESEEAADTLGQAPAEPDDIEPGPEQADGPAGEQAEEDLESTGLEDELSSAIEELQARMETGGDLLEPESVRVEESAPESEFIDLSAELGMEEALEGLAGTWTQNEGESTDAFDEYKDGIGQQLSREDTETHYNLGIAYMEMELFDEAAKEFKIALKEPRLEGDCYARLGLCAMAESKPDEAVMYYLKGLKVEGKSDDERKGMMYELALAYEAAGDEDEAFQLFTSISDLDPDYREVAEKLSSIDRKERYIPSDDGLIEVELL